MNISTSGTVIKDKTLAGDLSIQNCNDVWIDNCDFPTARFLNVAKWTLSKCSRIKITHCRFPVLGRGVTGFQSHIVEWWNTDGSEFSDNVVDITIEAGLDSGIGAEWHFDHRHHRSYNNKTHVTLNRKCYAVWRWRADTSTNVGCHGNTFLGDHLTVVGGPGSQILPSSSANCGTGDYMAQCVGQWHTTMNACMIDAPQCEVVWQGGAHDWKMSGNTFNAPIRMFDIHGVQMARNKFTSIKFTDEYSRPMPETSAVTWCDNQVSGPFTVASKIDAVKGWLVDCHQTPPAYSVVP